MNPKDLYCYLLILVVVASLAYAPSARADVKPHALISEGMVLQQKSAVNLWGTADPGEKVTVQFRGQSAAATAGDDGKWLVQVQSQEAGGPFPLSIAGKNTIEFKDVLVGEVWLLSGQSNMEYALFHCTGGDEAIAKSANPQLRLLTVPHADTLTPQSDITAKWVYAGPTTTRTFSAVGYWFGSKLQKELGVPVGLINCSYGGTTIEGWISGPVLANVPGRDKFCDYEAVKAQYEISVAKKKAEYAQQVAEARKNGQAPPPKLLVMPMRGPSMLWNGMGAPLLNYRIRGVAWYQGESNAYVGRADTYPVLLPTLIQQWRRDFNQGELPFLVFQLTPNRKPQTDPNEQSGIAVVQEAQFKACQSTPGTALVVTMDLGETDVHYKRKEPAGERGMKAALSLAYGRDIEYSGPLYAGASFEGNRAILRFTHLGGGLVAQGEKLTGFVIAGEDRKFVWAEAKIDGDTVIVSSPQVARPVAVRYGWADYPTVNLFNKAGLPASPCRTDNWPVQR